MADAGAAEPPYRPSHSPGLIAAFLVEVADEYGYGGGYARHRLCSPHLSSVFGSARRCHYIWNELQRENDCWYVLKSRAASVEPVWFEDHEQNGGGHEGEGE